MNGSPAEGLWIAVSTSLRQKVNLETAFISVRKNAFSCQQNDSPEYKTKLVQIKTSTGSLSIFRCSTGSNVALDGEWRRQLRVSRITYGSDELLAQLFPSFLAVKGRAKAAGGLWPEVEAALLYASMARVLSPSFSKVMPTRHWMKASFWLAFCRSSSAA